MSLLFIANIILIAFLCVMLIIISVTNILFLYSLIKYKDDKRRFNFLFLKYSLINMFFCNTVIFSLAFYLVLLLGGLK